jgi:GDP-L-fucose synthase
MMHRCHEAKNAGASEVVVWGSGKPMKRVVGSDGELVFDASKPDGTQRKFMDVFRLSALG